MPMNMERGGAGWAGVGEPEDVEAGTSEGRLRAELERLREQVEAARDILGCDLIGMRGLALHEGAEARMAEVQALREDLKRERAEHHKTSDAFVEECRKNDLLKQEWEEARAKSPSPKDGYDIKCLRDNERAFRADREAAIAFLNERYKYNDDWYARENNSPLVKAFEAALKLEAAGHGSCAAERAWDMHAEVTKVLAKYMAEVEKAK